MAHGSAGCTGSMVLAAAPGGGLRELSIMAEGEWGASVSHGERGNKRERRRCQTPLNNQLLSELTEQELTHYLGTGTKPFMRDPPPSPTHL